MNSTDWRLIQDNAWPMLEALLRITIPLTALSFLLGLILALFVALARLSSRKYLSLPARAFISAVRGTPLLVQLSLIYYGLPQFGIQIEPFPSAVIAFSVNVAGYAAEVIRASILSIPKGQWEAGTTIGMDYGTTLRRIVLPQATRTAVPPLSNTLISLLKDTSLASVITVSEMFRVAQVAAAQSFQFFTLYLVAAVYYWVVCVALSAGQNRLEARFDRYVAR